MFRYKGLKVGVTRKVQFIGNRIDWSDSYPTIGQLSIAHKLYKFFLSFGQCLSLCNGSVRFLVQWFLVSVVSCRIRLHLLNRLMGVPRPKHSLSTHVKLPKVKVTHLMSVLFTLSLTSPGTSRKTIRDSPLLFLSLFINRPFRFTIVRLLFKLNHNRLNT